MSDRRGLIGEARVYASVDWHWDVGMAAIDSALEGLAIAVLGELEFAYVYTAS